MLLWIWSLFGISFFLAGFSIVCLRSWRNSAVSLQEGVSILKPLKGADSDLYENIQSFFRLRGPQHEILFSVADVQDPAVPIVDTLMKRYPEVKARLYIGDTPALNPKVGNLIRSYREASYDLVLISDSNVRVAEDYLEKMLAEMDEGVGVVTSTVAGTAGEGFGGALEATYLNTFFARGMALAFLFGKPCVIGKSMLFRRSVLNSTGGIAALGEYLAEDYMIGEKIRGLGLEIRLAKDAVPQHIGAYSFSSFWNRHVRWGVIRKVHAPIAFLLEPLSSALLASIAGALVLQASYSMSFDTTFLALLLSLGGLDGLVSWITSRKISRDFAWSWLLRELLFFPMWIRIAFGNKVQWRGHRLPIRFGGKIAVESGVEVEEMEWTVAQENQEASFGALLPARIKLRDTISTAIGGTGNPRAMLPEA